MLPGVRHRLGDVVHGCGSHLKPSECVNKETGAPAQQVANQFLGCPRKADSEKTAAVTPEDETIRTQRPVVCVPLTQTAPYCPFAMVSSTTIGLNRTGNAYYRAPQMRK
ncbi:hypothetical protein TNCV_315001 [Trichonephila clavipes]|nr:hypothetical protein TNCV_315001 [Trichonephila clavipes]